MEMQLVIFIFAVFIAAISTAISGVVARQAGIDAVSTPKIILGSISTLAVAAIIIWGLVNLKWYLAIVVAIAIFISLGLVIRIITLRSESAFIAAFKLMPVVDIFTIVAACYLWLGLIRVD